MNNLEERIPPLDEIPDLNLSEREKETRQRFVKEYMVDQDALRACLRLGYSYPFASQFSKSFMQCPFVQQLLSKADDSPTEDEEVDELKEKLRIRNHLWREARNYGPGSSQAARVAALAKLSSFYGMDAPTRTKNEHTGPNGEPLGDSVGVFIYPGAVTEEQWAQQAQAQQEELTKT